MLFFFTALRKQTEYRALSFRPDNLETGLDFLSFIQSKGEAIISIHFVDEHGAIDIPVEALDGKPFAKPIQQLEAQWKAILEQPREPSKHTQQLIDLTRQRITTNGHLLTHLDLTINRLESLIGRATSLVQHPSGNATLVNHYTRLISGLERQVKRVRNAQKLAIHKLNQLQQE